MTGVGKLFILVLVAAFVLAGCGGSTETEASGLQAENKDLRQENGRLDEEVQRLQGEVERLQGEVEDAGETTEPEVPETESTSQEDEVREAEPEESSGGGLAVAGPGDVSGEELPEIMPDDFPLPAGAVTDYVSETDYNFSLNFVIDSEFDTTSAFYDEQLPAGGWEETDRTEGTVEGLKGVETTWERGTYIPEGSPQDSDYEQAKERLTLDVYEIEPSGVIVEIFWNDYERLSDDSGEQEEDQPSS
jgi:hypothetical protein